MKLRFDSIHAEMKRFYGGLVEKYGPTAKAVDSNSSEAQVTRFEQLLKIGDRSVAFSINDYGCGYGALAEYMNAQGYTFEYRGFDISNRMIAQAGKLHDGRDHCKFSTDESLLTAADYTVACGVFCIKLQTSEEEWKEYVLHIMERVSRLSKKGFAFNMMTRYSDADRMRPDLYYADPCFVFDYCKTKFSRHVALLHDYGLYEFTILVRK